MVLQEEMRKKPQFTVIYPIRCVRITPLLFMFFFKNRFNKCAFVPADCSLLQQCLLNQLKLPFIK
jgi:hypothetical protein